MTRDPRRDEGDVWGENFPYHQVNGPRRRRRWRWRVAMATTLLLALVLVVWGVGLWRGWW